MVVKTLKVEYTGEEIYKMKVVDKSLFIYYNTDKINEEELLKQFSNSNFKLVPRTYNLHISAKDQKIFDEYFEKYKSQITIFSQNPRFIAKVSLNSEEEYENILKLNNEDIRIKPFLSRLQFNNLTKNTKN